VGKGQRIGGSTKIPIGDMARESLGKIFPDLTTEQIEAIKTGKPVPPSPNWVDSVRRDPIILPGNKGEVEDLKKKLESAAVNAHLLNQSIPKYGPLVSALLIVSEPKRVNWARRAVNRFLAQTYPNKQLVIVNAAGMPVTSGVSRDVKEIPFEPGDRHPEPTVGGMRNFALELADGDMIYPCWDDDDVYSQHLLSYLVAACRPGRGAALAQQIRVHVWNSSAYMYGQRDGIPGTMLFPRAPLANAWFDHTRRFGDADAFFSRYAARLIDAAHNAAYPETTLHLAVYHDSNASPVDEFMGPFGQSDHKGRIALAGPEAKFLRDVLEASGFKVGTGVPETSTQEPAAADTVAPLSGAGVGG